MSETTETVTDQTDDTSSIPDETTEHDQSGEGTEITEGRKGNPEAAKWRTHAREVEAERDTLTARVQALQAAEVVRLATGPGKLHDGSDLPDDLDSLLDESGDVDPGAVTEAVDRLRENKPHLAAPAFGGSVGQGERSTSTGSSWADVIRG